MVDKSPCMHGERRGGDGAQDRAETAERQRRDVELDCQNRLQLQDDHTAGEGSIALQRERCPSVPPASADPPETRCSWGWAGRGLLWVGELGSQQHATAVGDQNKQRNGLETTKGLKALDCVAQPGNSKGLCNLELKHPEWHSRSSGNFRCSQFRCGSGYLGRCMGTEPPALVWERGALSCPAMLTALGRRDGGVEPPGMPDFVRKALWLPPGAGGGLSKRLERAVHPLEQRQSDSVRGRQMLKRCWLFVLVVVVLCILVVSPVSPSRLAEGKVTLSLSDSANARFWQVNFYFCVFLIPGNTVFAIGKRGNQQGGITSRCPTGECWWRVCCQTPCTNLPSKSWREKRKANGVCLFTNGPQRQVCIQKVLGVTHVLGFKLWNRADLRESQNKWLPGAAEGWEHGKSLSPAACISAAVPWRAHRDCSCGTMRTGRGGLGISGGRVCSLDPCSWVCPFLWEEQPGCCPSLWAANLNSASTTEKPWGPLWYREVVHNNQITTSFQLSDSSSLVQSACS